MRVFWLAILCMLSLACFAGSTSEGTLQLLSRSKVELNNPELSNAQWQWLREHRKIRLAVWQPISPPYDITTGLNDYGGINADFIGLIAENLGVHVEVVMFPDYATALAGLRNEEADFIGQASENQHHQGLMLSHPYSDNVAVEVINTDAVGNSIRKIAISPVYNRERVLARYPGASEVVFSSSRHAMESLAFRKIDRFFCDSITARYLVSQSNLSNLSIRPVTPAYQAPGFSFAAPQRMHTWIEILNVMLKALPESAEVDILRRWNGGIPLSLSEEQPVFTSLERKWIEEHSRVRVAIAEGNEPIAFFDETGQLRGTIADILTALRLRTGLSFDIQRYPSILAAFAAVKNGQSELVAGGTQEGVWQAKLLTTRTWLYNSWVMVGRTNHIPGALTQRVISLRGEAPEAWLKRQGIGQPEQVNTWNEGLLKVVNGESDMMIVPLIVANAQLTQKAFSSLKIIASLDVDPMRFTFGASRQAWPLVTILNKALINIPPEDLHALTRSGSIGNSFSSTTAVRTHEGITKAFIAAGLLFCAAGLYIVWRRRHYRLLKILNAIPAPVYLCDRQGRLLAGNAAMHQALGAGDKPLNGSLLSQWLNEEKVRGRITLPDGRRLRLWQEKISGKRYRLGGWLDMTRQHHVMGVLREARRRADSASKVKSTFLATMSHEIRTPISAITGMLELVMKRGGDTPENRQSIRIARDAAQSLLMLIGNVLDVSRIESGRLVLHPQRASLRELIESSAVMFEGMAAQKGLRFALEIDTKISGDVLVDTMRLRQIIVNLVGNAIKFTDSGHIILRALPEWADNERIMLRLEVEDTGPGIETDLQQRLFRPFEQGENDRMAQGSGLGLYITRSIAQMMGGGISLQSQPGEGTRMTVTLALPLLESVATPVRSSPCAGKRRVLDILIVDDNPAGLLLLTQQLNWFGHRVISCSGADAALEKLASTSIDAVMSDCNMPGMSGYSLAQTVRERWPSLPFFGVTADARESVRDNALAAGMTDCLFKPVTLAMLEALLAPLCATDVNTMTAISTLPSLVASVVDTLPAALLEGENLNTFLSLQITVLDDTLESIAHWQKCPEEVALDQVLHRLRGGIQLLGITDIEACCLAQETAPDAVGMSGLNAVLHELRNVLQQWKATGLHPEKNVLRDNEDKSAS